ncbi:hypothetical protein Pmani_032265 [Petrolisthes manimaculis]|uniref:Uncharacterized protein n=1 Tax=Petrolisthes manimaculis TaxID=1843537 RepID=A0AAE1NS15_9EUCA|nr:hypothetical protein Pmani_032265 [Petrolisthes manimaculis]
MPVIRSRRKATEVSPSIEVVEEETASVTLPNSTQNVQELKRECGGGDEAAVVDYIKGGPKFNLRCKIFRKGEMPRHFFDFMLDNGTLRHLKII